MKNALITFVTLLAAFSLPGQTINLAQLTDEEHATVVNRKLSMLTGNKQGVSLDERDGDGLVWLTGVTFGSGTIEADFRGANKPGQSFIGIAFHGVDDSRFEAVYFRPFNFKSPDPSRRAHAVQYISMPESDWSRLRREHPSVYENDLFSEVDPDDWFHARMVVTGETVSVFVNQDAKPSLVVKRLSNITSGKVGLWVGNGSGGSFSQLSITK